MIYDKFPEKARELADIDIIGVVSENDRTAVMLAGAKVLKNILTAPKSTAHVADNRYGRHRQAKGSYRQAQRHFKFAGVRQMGH